MANNRTRWVTLEVYPDNPEQVAAFEWLKSDPAAMCSGMYIKHEAEKEGGKDHIHVMLYVDNAIRYKKEGEQNVCPGFASRFGTFEGFHDKDNKRMLYKSRGDELPEGKKWQTYPVFGMVQAVTDPQSLAWYFLHARYADRNKKRYEYEELQFFGTDTDRFRRLYNTESTNALSDFNRAYNLAKGCTTGRQFMDRVCEAGYGDVIEYVRKNPAFVRDFLLSRPERADIIK